MDTGDIKCFPAHVADKLQAYVYRLIDPRNGETFYIGKGRGNRVFAHIRDEQNLEGDDLSNKMDRVREIRLKGFDVAHVIHRHGMDDKTAVEIEAALIDAYAGLTNDAGGVENNDRGAMHVREIMQLYAAEPAVFRHKALLICINREATRKSVYEATRYCWRINKKRAGQAEVVLAVQLGLIVEAFIDCRWLEATAANFPGREPCPGRWGFEGTVAPKEIRKLYVGKRVPDEFRKKGAANPIKYTWQ